MFDYHNDIDLFDRPEGFELQLCWYNRIKGQCMYKYDLTDHTFMELDYVIATTNLSYIARNDTYKLEGRYHKKISDFVKNMNKVYFQNILLSSSLCNLICYIV